MTALLTTVMFAGLIYIGYLHDKLGDAKKDLSDALEQLKAKENRLEYVTHEWRELIMKINLPEIKKSPK